MSSRRNPYRGADARTRAAKAQGYPARSVFKLDEIDQRTHLFLAGQHVLDLGAAPGSWSLYASQRVGSKGRVLAIDLKAITQAFPPNVSVHQGDALRLESEVIEREAPYDVVLSDMAPSTSGNKVQDQAQSFELFEAALAVAERHGKPGSHFVAKLFMGPDFAEARRRLGEAYEKSKVVRPKGTRQVSSEVFLVGTAKR
jgi:23S rRNA (uridine2552-2'-O)-methyltransferase